MASRIDLALADRLRAIAGSPEPLAQLADALGDANTAMDPDHGSNDGEHDALHTLVELLQSDDATQQPRRRLADTEYDVAWFYTASDAQSPRDAAWQAWQVMRAPSSIANVFCVTDRDGTQHEIDLSESDTPERP